MLLVHPSYRSISGISIVVEDDIRQILTEMRDLLRDSRDYPSPWLFPEEAARYLKVSSSKVYKMIHEEKIPFHRIPDSRLIRLSVDELDEWMRSGRKDVSEEQVEKIIRRIV